MSAQSTDRPFAAPTSTSTYGAMAPSDGRPNGITRVFEETSSASVSASLDGMGNPNLHDPAPPQVFEPSSETTASTELRPDVAEPQYGEPERSATVIIPEASVVPTTPRRSLAMQQNGNPGSSTVRVQEFYSAESSSSVNEERNIRWMTRFTEFMRTAANRGANGLDRVMDNLGLAAGHQASQSFMASSVANVHRSNQMSFSPPEELPQRQAVVRQPPPSWSTTPPQPLFNEGQVAQLRQAHREYPLIYGQASEVGSDHSSRLQAEVQRQLEEYTMKYREELRLLQGEVDRLRGERREWEMSAMGSRESGGEARGAFVQDPRSGTREIPQPVARIESSAVSAGVPAVQNGVQPTANNLPQHPALPREDPEPLLGNSRDPRGCLRTDNQGLPREALEPLRGNPSEPQGPTLPREAPEPLPGNFRDPQGCSYTDNQGLPREAPEPLQGNSGDPQGCLRFYVTGAQSGGPYTVTGAQSGGHIKGPAGHSAGEQTSGPMIDGQGGGPNEPPRDQKSSDGKSEMKTPTQWLGTGGAADPMALLAGGMAQLQAVVLRQMQEKEKDKDKDGDQSPETVKPGSNALPQLPEVDPLTSSVDIMDWLEVITTTMQDLSDGSAEWWSRVRALAAEAYSRWTSASPVEKLGILPPREDALESGKWSRVNSRAASMVLMAVPNAVRSWCSVVLPGRFPRFSSDS